MEYAQKRNTIYKFLNEYKSTLKSLESLEFKLPILLNNSLIILTEIYEYCKDIITGKITLKSLSFRLIRDIIGLFTYQKNKTNKIEKKDNKNSNHKKKLLNAIKQ